MEPFITGEDIESVDILYGREKEINNLLSLARRHEIAGIIAPRRFGKTCVLKTMCTILRELDEDAYPVFFSAHDYGVSCNTDETYRRMAAIVATQMCKDGIIPEGEIQLYRKTNVEITTDPTENYESLGDLTTERQRQAVFKLAELLRTTEKPHKYLLLLIDEVDYLLLSAFERSDDFMRLRTAATQKQTVIKFWVAGPASWKTIVNSVGSPGLNCGLQNVTLRPLEKISFEKMWNYECSLITDVTLKNILASKSDFAYSKSGGVPFYGKFIGRQFLLNASDIQNLNNPSFMIVRDYLKDMFENRFFTPEEKDLMLNLSKRPINFGNNDPEGVSLLVEKGIAYKNGEYTELTMGYLIDYLCAHEQKISFDVPEKSLDSTQTIINELVDNINTLIKSINQTFLNKRNKQIFENPQSTLEDDILIRKIVHSSEEFHIFLSVVYLMFYERSKAECPSTGTKKPGQLLYEAEKAASTDKTKFKDSTDYFRNREFFKVLEPLRAGFGSHIREKLERKTETGQYGFGEALEHLKGNRNYPEDNEYPQLQTIILTKFKQELETIKKEVYSIK